MQVLVIGASGAIGTRLVPQLRERGHEVIGSSRSSGKAERLRALGAEPIVLDALDTKAIREAVSAARPDAIIYQVSALADARFSKNLDRTFAQTNRLRTEGIDALLAAARQVGVRRFVAQSFASYRYVRQGGPVKTEDDPLDPAPPATMRQTNAAMNHLDQAVTAAGGIALRKRQFPIIGDSGGISSWIHLEDAAAATVLALEHDGPTIYNIVDAEPAPPLPPLARPAGRRRRRGDDGNPSPRRLQRQGQERTRLDAALPRLAPRLHSGLWPAKSAQG